MSFLDDILDVGGSLWKNLTGSGVAGGIAKAAALGYLLKEVTESINKENSKPDTASSTQVDPGVREQVSPDTQHSIPVVYGTAFIGGIVSDAILTNGNQTMWYCITLSEKTGTLLSTGQDSIISFLEVYWDANKITFQSDGITAASVTDEEGSVVTDINGLVKIYCFNNGSNSPTPITGFSGTGLLPAYQLFPTWTAQHTMDNLVFALIRVDYNKDQGVTGLGNIEFKLSNSMTKSGDVLQDYLTNTRYGAGIDPAEIYSE
jgi:hypothetical protein